MTPDASGLSRTNRWLNALVGYFVGSLLYFFCLWMAVLAEHSGIFRSNPDQVPLTFTIPCAFGHLPPFWYRAVSHAALDHRLQPSVLYLAALLIAGLCAAIRRPLGPDRLPCLRAKAASGILFGAAATVNLWFSLSNVGLRFWRG